MIKVLTVGKNCMLYEYTTGKKISHCYEGMKDIKLKLVMDDKSELIISDELIQYNKGSGYFFDYLDTRYFIQDTSENILIRAGYVYLDGCDKISNIEKSEGLKIRSRVQYETSKALEDMILPDTTSSLFDKNVVTGETIRSFENGNYQYTLKITTVSRLVTMNQHRKVNNLSYYPHDRNMDKYGAMYVALYCKYISDDVDTVSERYSFADKMLSIYMDTLEAVGTDKYFYLNMMIKKRLLFDGDYING